jgi:hypothetical protein
VAAGTPSDQQHDVVIRDNNTAPVATHSANPAQAPKIAQRKMKVLGREYLLESGKATPV